MLFLLRVTAVWYPSKIACAVFSVLWIAVLGAGIAFALGLHGQHIGPTKHCITMITPANTEVVVCIILPLVNDTAIFLAINYRILAHTIVTDSPMVRLRIFFRWYGIIRTNEGVASERAAVLLVSEYYAWGIKWFNVTLRLAVAANLALLVVLKLPQIAVYRLMPVPFFALINAMACLVFRRIKFGLISPDGTSKISITGLSVDFNATENPSSPPFHYCRTHPTATGFGSDTLDIRVEIGRYEKDADASQEISKPITILA
ncbi:hypothetical protein MSAN_02312100 [Mycena sanguinolenta]|uniref:Uncharacterized protein n=1 Tax=Mycena sanguinolenta TaxID=230812 RepID=A0A8H6X855_9AGAR|nr:hypothetical protein MSAN_02312100 [Mycena sanguinolenta]